MAKNKSLVGEFWDFMRVRKAWWLAPIIFFLVVVGGFFLVSEVGGAVSPFIYVLF